MKIFEFLSTIAFITLIFGMVITLTMTLTAIFLMLIKESEKTVFWLKAITRLLLTAVIVFFILRFTDGQSLSSALPFYILGFYFYMVLFTLVDETQKEITQEHQETYFDYIFLKASAFNPYLIVLALIYFILAIIFPVLTNFYIPSLLLDLYNWLIGFKIILWIVYVIGGFSILYTIQYSFVFFASIIRGVLRLAK